MAVRWPRADDRWPMTADAALPAVAGTVGPVLRWPNVCSYPEAGVSLTGSTRLGLLARLRPAVVACYCMAFPVACHGLSFAA
jgi:hypothetical protein